jgi:hypothetical protein
MNVMYVHVDLGALIRFDITIKDNMRNIELKVIIAVLCTNSRVATFHVDTIIHTISISNILNATFRISTIPISDILNATFRI